MQVFMLYLIGYGNQVPDDFLERLAFAAPENGCLVLDIRSRRRSWARAYSAPQVEYLVKKQGHDYIWLQELGNSNRNGRRQKVRLVNELVGMKCLEGLIRRSARPVVLMCAERLSQDCHRSFVAGRLAERLESAGDQLEVRFL